MQKVKCLSCGKRIFGIEMEPDGEIIPEIKCPHCWEIVIVCRRPGKKSK